MKINCESCSASFDLPEIDLSDEEIMVTCPECGHIFLKDLSTISDEKINEEASIASDPDATQILDESTGFSETIDINQDIELPSPEIPAASHDDATKILSPITEKKNNETIEEEIIDESLSTDVSSDGIMHGFDFEDEVIEEDNLFTDPNIGKEDYNNEETQIFSEDNHEYSDSIPEENSETKFFVLNERGEFLEYFSEDEVIKAIESREIRRFEKISVDKENWVKLQQHKKFGDYFPELSEDSFDLNEFNELENSVSGYSKSNDTNKTQSRSKVFSLFLILFVISLSVGAYLLLKQQGSAEKVVQPLKEIKFLDLFQKDTYSDYLKTRSKLQDILSANPQSHHHKVMLAHTYLILARRFRESALSNIKEAERIVDELERLNPTHGEIIEARIHILLTRKKLTKAQSLFLSLPGNRGVLTDYLMGLSAYLRKDRDKITRGFDKYLTGKANFESPRYGYLLGLFYQKQGENDLATKVWSNNLLKFPYHISSKVKLAEVQNQNGDLEQALKLASEVIDSKKGSPYERAKVHILRAGIYSEGRTYNKVESEIKTAIELVPDNKNFKLSLANFFKKRKLLAEAEKIYLSLYQENPKHQVAFFALLDVFLEQNKIRESLDEVKKWSKANKANFAYYLILGKIKFRIKDYDQSLSNFKEAEKINPNSLSLLVKIASSYLRLGNEKKANEYLDKVKTMDPLSSLVDECLGNYYLEKNKYELAIKYLKAAVKKDPFYLEVKTQLAMVHRKIGQFDEAIDILTKITRQYPKYDVIFGNLGEIFFELKASDKAIESYNKAIKINPSNQKYYTELAKIYISETKGKKALEILEKVKSQYSGDENIDFLIGRAMIEEGNYTDAIASIKEGMNQKSPDKQDHYWLGYASYMSKEYERAAEELIAAIELDKDFYDARHYLAGTLLEMNYNEEAKKHLKILKQSKKDDQRIDLLLAKSSFIERNWKKTIKVLRKVNFETYGEKEFLLGQSYQMLNKFDSAINNYNKALKSGMKTPMIYFYLGELYKAKRNKVLAKKAFTKYVESGKDPDYLKQAKKELSRL